MSEPVYRIKPLEWKLDFDFINEKRLEAETILTTFMIDFEMDSNANVSYWWGYINNQGSRVAYPCDSIEDGKAQAEAYYRDRLMDALEAI